MADEVNDAQPGSSPGTGDAPVTDANAQAATDLTAGSRQGDHAESTPPAKTEFEEFKSSVATATGKEVPKQDDKSKDEAGAPIEDEPDASGKSKDKASKADQAQPGAEDDDVLSHDEDDQAEAGDDKAEGEGAAAEAVPQKLTDRPEWQAAVKIADKLGPAAGKEMRSLMRGMFKREYTLNETIAQLKPAKVVVDDILKSVGGSEQGLKNIHHLIRTFDGDPAESIPMLELLLNDAKKRGGMVLQAPELLTEAQALKKQLDDGLIDEAAYKKREGELIELQQSRLGIDRSKQQSERVRQEQEQQQLQARQQAAVKEIGAAAEAWEKHVLATDPDFPALKSFHHDRVIKLAEAECNRLGRMLTGKEAKGIADEALKQVKAEALKLRPKPRPKTVIGGGEGSSVNRRQQPMNELDEFRQTVEDAKKRN